MKCESLLCCDCDLGMGRWGFGFCCVMREREGR